MSSSIFPLYREYLARLFQTSSSINSMLLHRNQHEIIMSTSNGEIIFWDLRNNAANSIFPDPEGGPIHSLSIDPDVTSLASVNSSGQLIVWSLNGNSVWKPLERVSLTLLTNLVLRPLGHFTSILSITLHLLYRNKKSYGYSIRPPVFILT